MLDRLGLESRADWDQILGEDIAFVATESSRQVGQSLKTLEKIYSRTGRRNENSYTWSELEAGVVDFHLSRRRVH